MPEFDERTEKNLGTLLPEAEAQAREFLRRLPPAGITAKIVGGSRTYAEQDVLYAKGRTAPGARVTNARAGQSNHNFGIAWDIGIFQGTRYLGESPLYDVAGHIGERIGLEWGGSWNSITDKPHFQCKTGLTLAQLRHLHDTHQPIPIQPLNIDPEVLVFSKGAPVPVPALLLEHQTWVGVRAMSQVFGGEVLRATGSPLEIVLAVHGEDQVIQGRVIEGIGYARFAELNALYKLRYRFNSESLRLEVL